MRINQSPLPANICATLALQCRALRVASFFGGTKNDRQHWIQSCLCAMGCLRGVCGGVWVLLCDLFLNDSDNLHRGDNIIHIIMVVNADVQFPIIMFLPDNGFLQDVLSPKPVLYFILGHE